MKPSHFSGTYTLKVNTAYISNGSYYQTDHAGRIVSYDGGLSLDSAPRSFSHQRNLPGKMSGEDSSHLIASSNGGSGKVDNLVRMDSAVNQRDYRAMERENTELLKEGKEVELHGSMTYSDETTRPDCFMVTRDVYDPNTGERDVEHYSWSNIDMEQFENDETWVSLADTFPNPGAEQRVDFGAEECTGLTSAESVDYDFFGPDSSLSDSLENDTFSSNSNDNCNSDSRLSL